MSDARPRDGPEVSAVAMASAGGTDLAGLVNAYEAAANSHDLETIMAMFAEGAEFEMVGRITVPRLVLRGYRNAVITDLRGRTFLDVDGLAIHPSRPVAAPPGSAG